MPRHMESPALASLSDPLVQQLLHSPYMASLGTVSPNRSIHMVAVGYWFDGAHRFIATASRRRTCYRSKNVSVMIDPHDPAAS